MATIEDIVNKSGVSRSTVFRFLNGYNVRESSKKQVIEAMKELNYKVEEINKHKNFVIEVSIPNNYHEFQGFIKVVQGIVESAEELGISVQLARRVEKQIDEDYEKWDNKNQNKGVLVVGKGKSDEMKELAILSRKKIPHIFINREFIDKGISHVSTDLEAAAYDIVSYLIKKGHKKILAIGNPEELLVDEKKINGYKKALKENGLELDPKFYFEISNSIQWEKIVQETLTSKNIPDAYFGLCDSTAIKFINIARKLGFEIPHDISVVGMDGIDMASYCYPPLTTVDVPFRLMGMVAVKQMMHLFNYDYSSVKIMLDHDIVERESVRDK